MKTDAATEKGDTTRAIDNGCGTFAGANSKIGSFVAMAAPIASYVGGKPGGGGHKALGGPYGAGVLAANVSLERSEAKARDGEDAHP